jgi:integrase
VPHISLTQLDAERLRPTDTDEIYWDKHLPGFGLRVSSKGVKTFLVQYRVRQPDGSKPTERQQKLGWLEYMSVADARELARQHKARAASGIDPVAEKRAAKAAEETAKAAEEAQRKTDEFTLAKLVDRYEAEYVRPNRKPLGAYTKMALLKRWARELGDRPANAITREDVVQFRKDYLEGRSDGRVHATQLIGALRHLYKWAKEEELVAINNPVVDIAKAAKSKARERCLTHDEIKRFWAACNQIGWPAGQIFKLLLITGQREREIGHLEWETELDPDNRVINLPGARTKNGRAHTVHLSDLAMDIVQGLPRINGSKYVFTINGEVPFTAFHDAKVRVHALMGDNVPHWMVRDLRRTATTLMAEIGVAPHVADKILNHTSGEIRGVAAVYNQFKYLDERKSALDALASKVAELVGLNVVPLRKQG